MKKKITLSEFDALDWLDDVWNHLPEEHKKGYNKFIDYVRNLFDFHEKTSNITFGIIDKFFFKQYPEIAEKDFRELAFITSDVHSKYSDNFPIMVQKLISDQKAGKNVKEIYSNFDTMQAKVAEVPQPALLTPEDHKKYPGLSTAQWQKKMSKHNAEVMKRFNYEQKRKKEFMDYVKKSMLKRFPDIQNFGTGELIVYNYKWDEMYRRYKIVCNLHLRVIDFGLYDDEGFPVGEMDKDIIQEIKKLPKEKQAEGHARQKLRRIGAKP